MEDVLSEEISDEHCELEIRIEAEDVEFVKWFSSASDTYSALNTQQWTFPIELRKMEDKLTCDTERLLMCEDFIAGVCF